MRRRVAVFASGGGTNLQALLDQLNGRSTSVAAVALVVSDRVDARALERAEAAGVPARVVPVAGRAEAESADETAALLETHEIDLIALAGYLRLVPRDLIAMYRGRIINIHPALLPSFGGKGMYGLNVHRAVLEAGCTVTGATVHHVTERYDEGRAVAQWPVPVLPGDDIDTLAARVLRVEHALYPLAIERLVRDTFARDGAGRSEAPSAVSRLIEGSAAGRSAFATGGPFFGWTEDATGLEHSMRAAFGLTTGA